MPIGKYAIKVDINGISAEAESLLAIAAVLWSEMALALLREMATNL
jgi:hypothetical protein